MVALATLISVPAWAATTVCTTLTYGQAPYDTAIIAVASNFYGAAQDMVADFQADYGEDTAITICHNSTTHLLAEINNGTELPAVLSGTSFPHYDYFFAANASAPDSLYDDGNGSIGYAPYSYVKGIPVFFADSDKISSTSGLIANQGTSTISASDLSGYAINTALTNEDDIIAVASTDAPYGVKAHAIINSIQGTSLPTTIPSYVVDPLYDNVSLVYEDVMDDKTVTSGFGSKGQICAKIGDDVTYIEFTNDAYTLDQKAIQLQSSDINDALDDYLDGVIGTSAWEDFCDDNCYGTP